jgi:hypothetical protein
MSRLDAPDILTLNRLLAPGAAAMWRPSSSSIWRQPTNQNRAIIGIRVTRV